MATQINRRPMPFLKWMFLLLLLIFACFGIFLATVDRLCHASIEKWAPYYPNAVVISADHNYLYPRAIGDSRVVLSSDDDVETVKQFYRDLMISLLQAEETHGLAATNWRVEADPENNGSIIILYSSCAV